MDYAYPERRKTKKDLKKKRKDRVYKKGGKFRGKDIQIEYTEKIERTEKKSGKKSKKKKKK